MRIEIADFDKVETGFSALPAGTYDATVTGCQQKKGKEKGTPYIGWELTITGPTMAGRKLFENTFFMEEKQRWTTKKMVVGCGCTFTPQGFATEDCLGKRVELVLGQKENNGRLDNSIDKINPKA